MGQAWEDLDQLARRGALQPTGYALSRHVTDIEQWAELTRRAVRVIEGMAWVLGDLLIAGEERWGEAVSQYYDTIGLSESKVANLKWCARAVPRDLRRPTLSWSHHAAVAGLLNDAADREAGIVLLDNAEALGWSEKQLRDEVRQYREAAGKLAHQRRQIKMDLVTSLDVFDVVRAAAPELEHPEALVQTLAEWLLSPAATRFLQEVLDARAAAGLEQ